MISTGFNVRFVYGFDVAIVIFDVILLVVAAHNQSMPEAHRSCSTYNQIQNQMTKKLKISNIDITGEDALQFLQGQLTNDLTRLESESEIRAAWCNPKGRVIWFGTIASIDSGFRLSAPAETAEIIVQRLAVFRFRSKVNFEVNDHGTEIDAKDLIRRGCPFVGEYQIEQFTPHMLNLDLLDAISLDKGCYTGQEIVARTHYKGATKRRTLLFQSDLPAKVGDKIDNDERTIGEVLNVSERHLLAVVMMDKVGGRVHIAGNTLAPAQLPYELSR